MNRKLCLIVAAAMAVTAGSASIGAQQPNAARPSLLATKASLFSTIQGTALNWCGPRISGRW